MELSEITPLILTYNEEANVARTLAGVAWASYVVVVDSGSSDDTLRHLSERANVTVCERAFDNHTAQWNFGLDQIRTQWVLALDADYVCPDSLVNELQELEPTQDAYAANFRYCIYGRPLRGTLYPSRVVLFRADRYRYRQDGHTQVLDVSGPIGQLRSVIDHDDRKPLARWLESQAKYADLEVEKLLATPHAQLGWKDRLRKKIVFAPVLTLLYCLFGKGLVLDGWPGIFYTLQRVYAELLLAMKLVEKKVASSE